MLFFLVTVSLTANAQTNTFPSTGAVGIGTTSPNASSLLEIKSTTKGFLAPRMTIAQRNAIVTPATGLFIYQTNSTPGFYYYDGSAWKAVSGASSTGANTSLSNLASTSINVALLPDTSNKRNLGSPSKNWKNIFTNTLTFADGSAQTKAFIPYTAGTGISISGNVISSTGSGGSGWSLTGNAGTNPSTNFLGTTDAQSLVFKVNGLRAGFIDYSTCCSGTRNTSFGQIALSSLTTGADNTATGYGALYTNTTGNQNVAYGKYALYNNNANDNTAYGFNAMFFNTAGAGNTAIGITALQNNTSGSNNVAVGNFALGNNFTGSNNTAIGFGAEVGAPDLTNATAIGANATVNISNAVVLGNNANVGIGTSVPGDRLSIKGGAISFHNTSNDVPYVGLDYDASADAMRFRVNLASTLLNTTYVTIKRATGYVGIGTTSPGDLLDVAGRMRVRTGGGTAGTWFMNAANTVDAGLVGMLNDNFIGLYGTGTGWGFIMNTTSGNVGIGTFNPGYKLSVNGTIQSKEVRVETGWSDYVFEKGYKLRSLDSVAEYIKQNKHLPGIPSAKEIQDNGLAVGEVQTKMMAKIEELTLYVIQLQKEITQLKATKK